MHASTRPNGRPDGSSEAFFSAVRCGVRLLNSPARPAGVRRTLSQEKKSQSNKVAARIGDHRLRRCRSPAACIDRPHDVPFIRESDDDDVHAWAWTRRRVARRQQANNGPAGEGSNVQEEQRNMVKEVFGCFKTRTAYLILRRLALASLACRSLH